MVRIGTILYGSHANLPPLDLKKIPPQVRCFRVYLGGSKYLLRRWPGCLGPKRCVFFLVLIDFVVEILLGPEIPLEWSH